MLFSILFDAFIAVVFALILLYLLAYSFDCLFFERKETVFSLDVFFDKIKKFVERGTNGPGNYDKRSN